MIPEMKNGRPVPESIEPTDDYFAVRKIVREWTNTGEVVVMGTTPDGEFYLLRRADDKDSANPTVWPVPADGGYPDDAFDPEKLEPAEYDDLSDDEHAYPFPSDKYESVRAFATSLIG